MTELDDVLRQSFARIAEPGDPAGVVDSIRSRMAAGDTGTPASTSGFGSTAGWVVPWIFGGAVLAVGGLVLGTSGLLDPVFAPEPASQTVQLQATVDALDCPSGSPIATLAAGNRVLAIARSDDSAYLGVRNPYDTSGTVWLPAAVVIADPGEATIESLPVDGCGTAETTLIAPTAEPVPTATAAPQKPASDTTAPSIQKASAAPTLIINDEQTVVEVQASDNVGVTSVAVSISGAYSGSASMSKVGSVWQLSFSIAEDNYYGDITFTITAIDAAGNQSAPSTVVVDHQYFG